MQASFVSQLLQRFASKSPKFFRIIQYTLGGLTALALAVIYLHSKNILRFSDPELESGVLSICDDLWKFTAGGTVVALTTTTKADLIAPEVKANVINEVMGSDGQP